MTDRTETCTPEERRFLDLMHQFYLQEAQGDSMRATIKFDLFSKSLGDGTSGHTLVNALYDSRGNKD